MDEEARRQRLATVAKWGIGLAGAVIISPFVFLAVKGIVGLALAVAVGMAVIQLAPVFSMKLANWKMRLIVQEAGANPIETFQNDYIDRFKEVEAKDQELEEWDMELRNYDDDLVGIKRDYPAEAASYEEISQQMHDGLADARHEQTQARADLAEYDRTITKMKRLYKMALAAQRVTSFSKSAEERVMQDIKRQAALDSVRSNLNRSLARLNTAMAKRQARPALPGTTQPALPEPSPAQTIDVTPVPERVAVRRTPRKEA